MKQTINYNYNLDLDNVLEFDNYAKFKILKDTYYFVPLKRGEDEVEDIINCSKELKQNKIECHDIMINKFGKVISLMGEAKYVLLRVVGDEEEEYSISDLTNINNRLVLTSNKSKIYRNNWQELWSSKVDYFEYQISEYGKDKKGLLESFSYYVGLAENAISYVNSAISKHNMTELDRITLAHRQIFYPNYKLNYLNPLSLIFDLEVRDVAEYLKAEFFYGEDAISELKYYLKVRKLGPLSYHMLFARLLYPSYYFDNFELIMDYNENEDRLINILNKVSDYEDFLKESYMIISAYYPIEKIDWLLKKEL